MPCSFNDTVQYVSSYLVLIRVSVVYLNGVDDKQYNEQRGYRYIPKGKDEERGYRKVTKLKQKSNLQSIHSVVKCFFNGN